MGPRFINRGEWNKRSPGDRRVLASMGPRLINRGELKYQNNKKGNRCFNGAAAYKPRRGVRALLLHNWLLRFNGAAAYKPRRALILVKFQCGVDASMGPRLINRGETSFACARSAAIESFNGAAAYKPRRDRPPNGTSIGS